MRLIVSIGAISLVLLSDALSAQEASTPKTAPESNSSGVFANGSKNPEAIPDTTAVILVLQTLVMSPDTKPGFVLANIQRVGLKSKKDQELFVREMQHLHGVLQQTTAKARDMQAANRGPAKNAAEAEENRKTAVAPFEATVDSYNKLLEMLSPEGANTLRSYVMAEKKHMVTALSPTAASQGAK